jgi:prepilin-type N-terminal cleavage/methylation domain-containing protein
LIKNFKLKIKNSSSGFTMIELLVVIALTAVLATISFVSIGGYRNENHLKDEGNKVAAALQNVHDNSVSQLNGKRWGMRFTNGTSSDTYQQFSGTSFASGTPGAAYALGYNLAFGNPATSSEDIIFNPITGALPSDATVNIIPNPANGMAENIIVDTLGQITTRFETGLVGYWPMDEGTGTTAYDASGYGNNGTLTNSPTWQSGANCKVGDCLSFNPASSQYINVNNSNSLNVSTITMTAWVYLTSYSCPADRGIIVNKENQYEWGIRCNSGNLDAAISPNWAWYGTTQLVPLNGWHFVAVTWDGNAQNYYIDGQLSQSYSLTNKGSITSGSGCLRIGARNGCGTATSFFNGQIDDVRIYNRALSAQEIQDLYNAY